MPEVAPARTGAGAALGRRRALTGAVGVGLALPVLAACGGDGGGDTAADASPSSPETSDPETGGGDGGGGGSADALTSTSDVPVGGGVVNADAKVVVTQPEQGEFKAFTAVCTHQGCTVTGVTETINCPCHGSQFAIADGSVVGGPAPSPLAEVEITVEGDQVLRA
jgi:Rieske Fe-S protein